MIEDLILSLHGHRHQPHHLAARRWATANTLSHSCIPPVASCEMDDYKHEKEVFVSGMTGSSVGHINLISVAALVRGSCRRRPPQVLIAYSEGVGDTLCRRPD